MEALEFFTNQYAFLSPLLLPWLQKLCHDSAEEQLKVLFETELATPLQLVSCTNFSYRYIRTSIIPRLIQYIERGGNKGAGATDVYLRSKLAIHYARFVQEKEAQTMQQAMQQNGGKPPEKPPPPSPERKLLSALLQKQPLISRDQLTHIRLNARYFELLLTDILNDLCVAYKVTNILSVEKMAIIQYIRCLIYECEKKIKHDSDEINLNSYSGLICCNLLSILNDEYGAECVCDSEDTNLSNFKVFTDIIIENNVQFPSLKHEKESCEIEMEKLQRKLTQQQATLQRKKSFSQQSIGIVTGGNNDPMLKIPHTPQISGVGPLEYVRQNSADAFEDIDLSNTKQIMRGHDLTLSYGDETQQQQQPQPHQPRVVSFRLNNNDSNSNSPATALPPRIPLASRVRSQSYDADKVYALQPLPGPPPMNSVDSSINKTPSPQQYDTQQPPPPPLEITNHKSLPIGGTELQHNDTGTLEKKRMISMIDSSPTAAHNNQKTTFSRIQPPKPTDFSASADIKRGLTKTQFFGKYLIDSKIIGQGSFAVVRRCKRVTDDMILAMKIIKKKNIDDEDDMELIRREIQILLMLDHPNVIRVYDWCETNSRLFIVLDFCGGGNVLDRIIQKGSFSEFETAQLIRELAISIEYYHSRGVVHRDLKPENIMYSDDQYNQMKLIDFGMANTLKDKHGLELSTACGSPLYAAPEILNNEKYGAQVDMWSLGVITYLLLSGFPPFFDTQNIKNVYHMIKTCKYSFPAPFWDNISDAAKDFISHLLVLDVHQRYTAKDVLNHVWIKKTEGAAQNGDMMLYDDLDTDVPLDSSSNDFSSTDEDDLESGDDLDLDYDQILAEDIEIDADFNVNPLHSPVASKSLTKKKFEFMEPKTTTKKTDLLKRAATERVLKKLNRHKSDPQADAKKANKNDGDDGVLLRGKHGRAHTRNGSLAYMNQGTIFSAQRDHLQKQKGLMNKEREELTREASKVSKQRQEVLQLLDQHNEFKHVMTNFEREKAIFDQEKEKWLTAKGSVEKEKQRLGEVQQAMTERYEAEFDKFVSETQEQRRQLSEEYKRLNDERLAMKENNEQLTADLKRLHEERTQFETDRNNSLPTDIRKLRQDLENEWAKIEEERQRNEITSTQLKKMIKTLNTKEAEIETDHKQLLEIKEKIVQLEKEKEKELNSVKGDESQLTVKQQQRELQLLRAEFDCEKEEFIQLKVEFYNENIGSTDGKNVNELDWKRKYLLMKHDFDGYCDQMDEYCDNLESKCKEAEDKYQSLYKQFDDENTQLTTHITKKNEELSAQEERLRELEEAEEMWQHHSKETEALKKQLDDQQIKFDRISDEINSLHDQIANYKAQLEHYVDVEAELDQLKQQMLLIHEHGGTAGITIIPEEVDMDDTDKPKPRMQINNESAINSIKDLRIDKDNTEQAAIMNIKVGDRVELQKGWTGRIQYIGSVPPIKHEVIGLALDAPIPDGHDGKGLFVCKPKCGYFSQRWRIKRVINISTPRDKETGGHSNSLSLAAKTSENQFKTIRIKITDIDQLKANMNDDGGHLADNEEGDDGDNELVLVDYSTLPKTEPIAPVPARQSRYMEPIAPAALDNEKLGWILHRLRDTPIGPLDADGNNKIDLSEFVNYFLNTVNIKHDEIDRSVYAYAFALIDANGDGEITPLEYYRFFDIYRLFPDDHFVNGSVEYKVSCIKSYGLCGVPVNSHLFADDTRVYFHQSQFKYLIPWKKLQDRDDTSDDDDESTHLVFKSSSDRLHHATSNNHDKLALTNDDTESLYDDADAEQSALQALENGIIDEEEEDEDEMPMPKQYDLIPEDGDDDDEESSTVSAHDPLRAPPDMTDIHSFEGGGLYDAYIQSGNTPHSPNPPVKSNGSGLTDDAQQPQSQDEPHHPFAQFADATYSQSTTALPSGKQQVPKLDDNLSLDESKAADLMKEYSRSNAQLNLKKIGLEMSHEQIEQNRLIIAKEVQLIQEEKAKIHRLKEILEGELMKLGISKTDLDNLVNSNKANMPQSGSLSLRGAAYSMEDEEDAVSLGATPHYLGTLGRQHHFAFSSAVSAIHSVAATLSFDESLEREHELQIKILSDRVMKLQTLLSSNNIAIPKTPATAAAASQEIQYRETETATEANKKRVQRLAMVKTKSITVLDVSNYSFGMQLFFEQYDVDKFNCITFEGFFESLKVLELDDTPENELRAIFYFADVNENNGLNINEFLYALCVQFLNSILDRKLRLTFGQCDDDFNGALDTEEMREALEYLQIEMSETHYNAMFEAAQEAGVKGLEEDWDSVVDADSDEEDESGEEEEADPDLPCCDFVHFKYGLLTALPFACGDKELSDELRDYDQESPTRYVQSLLSLCWHILVQSFDLMDEDCDGLINSRETANVIEYLGITDKAYGDIQTLKGVFTKVMNEKNESKNKIDFKTFIRVMLQQYFRGISDQAIRCVFESHCQGLMAVSQFMASFEAIQSKLPQNRGDDNYKHVRFKSDNAHALSKLFKSNDKHNTGRLEWDTYVASIRESIVFNLEDNIRYAYLFGENWIHYNLKKTKKAIKSDQKEEEKDEKTKIKITITGDTNQNNLDCEEWLKSEFEKCKTNCGVDDIIALSNEYEWSITGLNTNDDAFKWWIMQQMGGATKVEWKTFRKIIYNLWFYSYFEMRMKREFKESFPDSNDDEVSLAELQQFVVRDDALLIGSRCHDHVLKLCYHAVDRNKRGRITYDEMIAVLQHMALYSMSEFVFLRFKYTLHGIVDEQNGETYVHKEDFATIARNNMLIFEDNSGDRDINFIKICNSSSFLRGLFDKFAVTQYRGDTVKKLNFENFCSAYLYRLLMELSCFYIDGLCGRAFDGDRDKQRLNDVGFDEYISVFRSLGFNCKTDRLFGRNHCESLAQCMFGTKRLSLSQLYVFLMNRAMVNNLELQIYGSFMQYAGDSRDYITSAECVGLVSYLNQNEIIHGKMYSLQKYVADYLKFWKHHYEINSNSKRVQKRQNNENINDKWYFESFLHCLTFHQFQLNHGRSHLLLKAMHLDREKMRILKLKGKNIQNERLLLNKEKKLHDFYTKMMQSIKKNQSKLVECKDRILDETNAIKKSTLGGDHDHADPDTVAAAHDLLLNPMDAPKHRTSALTLAKGRIRQNNLNTRRGSVVIRGGDSDSDSNSNDDDDDDDANANGDNNFLNRQSSHFANQISVELQLKDAGLPQDFNPFGGASSDTSSSVSSQQD